MEIKDEKKISESLLALFQLTGDYRYGTYHCNICNRNFNGRIAWVGHINRNSYHKQQYILLLPIYWQIRNTKIKLELLKNKPDPVTKTATKMLKSLGVNKNNIAFDKCIFCKTPFSLNNKLNDLYCLDCKQVLLAEFQSNDEITVKLNNKLNDLFKEFDSIISINSR